MSAGRGTQDYFEPDHWSFHLQSPLGLVRERFGLDELTVEQDLRGGGMRMTARRGDYGLVDWVTSMDDVVTAVATNFAARSCFVIDDVFPPAI